MKQLTTRGQLAMLLRQKGFFATLIANSQSFIDGAGEKPDIFYQVFYRPENSGRELMLELVAETEDDVHLGYDYISLNTARSAGGEIFDSIFQDLWPINCTS